MKNRIVMILVLALTFPIGLIFADDASFYFVDLVRFHVGANRTLIEEGQSPDRYAAIRAFDNDIATAWCVGPNEFSGATITASFRPTKVVTDSSHLFLAPGVFRSKSLYDANNRPKAYILRMTTKDNKTVTIKGEFEDNLCRDPGYAEDYEKPLEEFCKDRPRLSRSECEADYKNCNIKRKHGGGASIRLRPGCYKSFSLEIVSVYPGEKFHDTCISEIMLFNAITDWSEEGIAELGKHDNC